MLSGDDGDECTSSSEEEADSKGRPKRCPRPRLLKKILDQYCIQTGARNILALDRKVKRQQNNWEFASPITLTMKNSLAPVNDEFGHPS